MVRCCAQVLVGVLVSSAVAAPFVVPVDPAQSVIHFEICVGGSCAADSSPVAGSVSVALDSVTAPARIWLVDFDLQLTEDLDWLISWGIFGSLTANAQDVSILYAAPGVAIGPADVAGGAYTFIEVPTNATGLLSYVAGGIPCVLLQGAGLPCSDTRDLADQGTQSADEFAGSVASAARVVTLATTIDVSQPLDPENPDLGTLHAWGSVTGQVFVPAPQAGDANCDGSIDAFDIDPFILALTDPVGFVVANPGCELIAADVDGNGLINAFDIDPFVTLLVGD